MRRLHAALSFAVLALLVPGAALAQRAVIVVRHAEKISDQDERLSPAGIERAKRLAAMLENAGVTAIYSTDTERTRDTVRALADARRLKVQIYDVPAEKADAGPFVASVRAQAGDGVVLIVGHSNTVPAILKALGCVETIEIGHDDYDDLFVVVPNGKKPTLVRLKY